jgi:hypothetical protein
VPRSTAAETARRAEPRGIGSAHARDPLAREVKLLGALLGQVIVEQEGADLFELVESLRRTAIRRRKPSAGTVEADAPLAGRPLSELLAVARAFTAYFLLINLAEEKHRVRMLRRRERAGTLPESIADAVNQLARSELTTAQLRALLDRLLLRPVLTAHPTEARRRTVRSDGCIGCSIGSTIRASPAGRTAICGGGCARRSRSCGRRRRGVASDRHRWTRCAPRWSSSTRPCSG